MSAAHSWQAKCAIARQGRSQLTLFVLDDQADLCALELIQRIWYGSTAWRSSE
jgi:hypothetical protein